MKRNLAVLLLLIVSSVPLSATIISTPIVINTPTTIPAGDYWNVIAGGSITVNSGGSLTAYGDLITQAGRPIVVNSGGVITITSLVNFDSRGTLNVLYGGTFYLNANSFGNIYSGSVVTITGSMNIWSELALYSGGTVNVNNNGVMNVYTDGAVTVFSSATLNINSGGRLVLNAGKMYIEGTLNVAAYDIVRLLNGGELHIVDSGNGVFGNDATITVATGCLFIVEPNGTMTSHADLNVNTGGVATIDGMSTIGSYGSILVNGVLNIGDYVSVEYTGYIDIISGTCNVLDGGNLNFLYGAVLHVRHFLIIYPHGYVNLYDTALMNVYPQALVTMEEGLSIISLNYGGTLHMISGPTGYAKIAMKDRSILRFFDSLGTVIIDNGSFISMTGPSSLMPASCQISNTSGSTGKIITYEPHPFRGEGNFHRIIIDFYDDFNLGPQDSLIFKYGATFTFLDTTGSVLSIQSDPSTSEFACLEFRGLSGIGTYQLFGYLNQIQVFNGSTFKTSAAVNVVDIPNILGDQGSLLHFDGITPGRSLFGFRPASGGIVTEGDLWASNIHFQGPPVPSWGGITIRGGNASVFIDTCDIMEVGNSHALHLIGSFDPDNLIRGSSIVTALAPGTTVSGIFLDIDGNGAVSNLRVKCCNLHGFGNGVHNRRGYLQMQETTLIGHVVGIRNDTAVSYISNTCVLGCLNTGVIVDGGAPTGPFYMYDSRIYKNQNLQVQLINNAFANFYNSAIFYDIGNNTTCVLQALNGSNANAQSNWWGVYPITAAMFDAQGGSFIDTSNSLQSDPGVMCNCTNTPKFGCKMRPVASSISVRNYPNPFNPSTVIEYTLPEEMPVTLNVYTVTGALVSTLVNETVTAGTHRVTFTAPASGSSGLYLYELSTPAGVSRGRMMLMK